MYDGYEEGSTFDIDPMETSLCGICGHGSHKGQCWELLGASRGICPCVVFSVLSAEADGGPVLMVTVQPVTVRRSDDARRRSDDARR